MKNIQGRMIDANVTNRLRTDFWNYFELYLYRLRYITPNEPFVR